ncbi:CPBP family intramembrane glutamic endopeptidase [Marilutibacter maris]|uniref:CPBP family intramembrane glutamic endopeptidase n=1 Tax=Marilutibacter maris TaxID=1605891 RepID=UPI001CB9C51B|nr:CPBP family intramembrane glutamic endopeptidase [Lysobacter maris]
MDTTSPPIPRRRWIAALVAGTLAWVLAIAAAFILPQAVLGLRLQGSGHAVVGVLQLLFTVAALALVLRLVRVRWRDIGLVRQRLMRDIGIGLAVAVAFAVLQFAVIIPATGGAARSDVVANLEQMRGPGGVAGMAVLGALGAFAEELYFRGMLLHGLRGALGPGPLRTGAAVALVALLFGAVHGYQGWAGMVDTALYGGLTLSLLCLLCGGRLAAPIAAHVGWNLLALAALAWWY